ncbi:VanZ family protein [Actinoplanes sp. NPDC049265]|uniref:VanZ family protein n=1 Tax=Actinoplanes sp. NPDC049265 TaxID=3363902 RepID=UPI0037148394
MLRVRVLFLMYAAGVLAVTVVPVRAFDYWGHVPWQAMIRWIPFVVDPLSMTLNVVMFLPFGVLIPLLWPAAGATATRIGWLALSASLSIELTQLLLDVTIGSRRTVDVNDLIANTGGALIGWWLLRLASRREALAG